MGAPMLCRSYIQQQRSPFIALFHCDGLFKAAPNPSEGRSILIQNQQDPSTHLDSTVEGGLPWIVAYLILQLVLVVCVSAYPVGSLIRQLP
eukprot:Skav218460  [mRNA]  locus=scaffold538:570000:570657:- [translate_table: standard]